MLNALGLLKQRRFLPLFTTQFLGAFNDNLFKTSMVLFATYAVFNDPKMEANFNALATGLGILPFFLLSALAGQLADSRDKARIIRIVKTVEIGIMLLGATGLMVARFGHPSLGIGLMLGAVLCLGVHSTFFGPIKYAILPQHLKPCDVLGGTGLVEAGTYLAILLGTVTAGWIPIEGAAASVLIVALVGWFAGRQVPPAPREGPPLKLDYNPFTASWRLISATLHIPRLFLAIVAISFFWTIGAVLIIVFPPLVKNVLTADERVASFVIAVFSVGVAIGSVVINSMLRGRISAKFSPASVIAMGGFVVLFSFLARNWTPAPAGQYYDWAGFIHQPGAIPVLATLLAIAITGGMFVVPLYAFLTTTVEKDQTARTVAANNVVNSGAMTIGSILVIGITAMGVTPEDMLFLVAAMCLVSAWLAQKLHRACNDDAVGCLPTLRG
ncbi:putative MFS family arabinose efflux permease [Sphingomonas sp. PP-F2F-A104-K0414]|uniref:MFS transporter n=1 Tax=Sphingomonas sp. PP-F2F-A104-K0414 TaxID=2135661 RepID=UPI00105119AC|nr:MFS transporter [Sphingomonas sp. PP-F2F-A104-K0414]TCP98742.1 putative MFS family arabinose efflux permease [Sphingomonas sp. PP-F2F-A104-K0414]